MNRVSAGCYDLFRGPEYIGRVQRHNRKWWAITSAGRVLGIDFQTKAAARAAL